MKSTLPSYSEEGLDEENLLKLEEEYYRAKKHYTIKELALIFPEALEVTKQQMRETLEQLKECHQRMQSSVEHYYRYPPVKPIAEAVMEMILQKEVKPLESRLARLDYNLKVLQRGEESNMVDIEELKGRNDLRDIAQRYGLKLRKAGRECLTNCPFHKDNDPSMTISKRLFYCFSCGETGDAITFIEKMDGCDFQEAIKKL